MLTLMVPSEFSEGQQVTAKWLKKSLAFFSRLNETGDYGPLSGLRLSFLVANFHRKTPKPCPTGKFLEGSFSEMIFSLLLAVNFLTFGCC